MKSVIGYSNEEKAIAYRRMGNDPQVDFYNDEINRILSLWAFPRIIKLGETTISDEIPSIPDEAQALIDRFKKEREDYIKSNYPELSGL